MEVQHNELTQCFGANRTQNFGPECRVECDPASSSAARTPCAPCMRCHNMTLSHGLVWSEAHGTPLV